MRAHTHIDRERAHKDIQTHTHIHIFMHTHIDRERVHKHTHTHTHIHLYTHIDRERAQN